MDAAELLSPVLANLNDPFFMVKAVWSQFSPEMRVGIMALALLGFVGRARGWFD
jgi:hypothetical protein